METVAGGAVSQGMRVIPVAATGLGVVGAAFKSFEKVPQGFVAFRLQNGVARKPRDSVFPWGRDEGELPKLLRPGLKIKVPFTHSFDMISLQDQTTPLPSLAIDTASNRQHEIQASITWGVASEYDKKGDPIEYNVDYPELVFRAMYAAKDAQELTDTVTNICADGLRKILLDVDNIRTVDTRDVEAELIDLRGDDLLEYGAELRRLNVVSTAATSADVLGQALRSVDNMGAIGATTLGISSLVGLPSNGRQ